MEIKYRTGLCFLGLKPESSNFQSHLTIKDRSDLQLRLLSRSRGGCLYRYIIRNSKATRRRGDASDISICINIRSPVHIVLTWVLMRISSMPSYHYSRCSLQVACRVTWDLQETLDSHSFEETELQKKKRRFSRRITITVTPQLAGR